MSFQLGDRVTIKANTKDETSSSLFRKIHGATGKISEIYYLDYQPETERYEVTLDNTIEYGDERLKVIPGLYEDNLEHDESFKKPKKPNERAFESFVAFESNESTSKWYYGMADAHGIVSFIPEPAESEHWVDMDRMFDLGMIDMRAEATPEKKKYNTTLGMMLRMAQANMQRHSVVFRVELNKTTAEMVDDMISSGEYDTALNLIKAEAITIQLAKVGGTNSEKMWNAIPNPELDPMY